MIIAIQILFMVINFRSFAFYNMSTSRQQWAASTARIIHDVPLLLFPLSLANASPLVQTSKLFAPLFKLERWVASALFPYSTDLMSLVCRLFVVVFVD